MRRYRDLAESEDRESPLQVKLGKLADGVATFGYVAATFIFFSFLFKQIVMDNQYDVERIKAYLFNWQVALKDVVTSIILSIIVIVVAVPEGLPMMIAIVLSLNMRRLLRAKVLVRKLLGIEAAGSIDILFVDKTCTLTKAIFEPQMFVSGSLQSYQEFDKIPSALRSILGFAMRESTSAVIGEEGAIVGGNASDRALLSWLSSDTLKAKADTTLQKEILFNSERKFSAIQLKVGRENRPPLFGWFLPLSDKALRRSYHLLDYG